jgi:hypothetical protein
LHTAAPEKMAFNKLKILNDAKIKLDGTINQRKVAILFSTYGDIFLRSDGL